MSDKRPLIVDLDGTLVRSDLLAESYLALVRKSLHAVAMVLEDRA